MPHDQEINCFSDLEKDALDNSNRLMRISATEYPSANKGLSFNISFLGTYRLYL